MDFTQPHYCNKPTHVEQTQVLSQTVAYTVTTKIPAATSWEGHACHQWKNTKTITGYFFGSFDSTVFTKSVQYLSAKDCKRKVLELKCDNNMVKHGKNSDIAYFYN